MPRVLLIACYELGHQPLSLAWPLAALREAGYEAAVLDLSVDPFSEALASRAEIVGISVPMHTALRLGAEAARRVRAVNPGVHICLFGLYAWLNAEYVLSHLADSVIAGEVEAPLLALVHTLARGEDLTGIAGVSTRGSRSQPYLARLQFPVPDRSSLPPLDRYALYIDGEATRLAGYVEASRGCLHTCRHCPIAPVYKGRFFVVPVERVLADIRQQVAAGAGHITFGDPDFLNGPGHSLRVVRALHADFPDLTFDITAKVEHILKHRSVFRELRALGCTFVVSAIESLSDTVLQRLEKGHSAADIDAALAVLEAAGIALHPTLLPFTPWTTLEDYLDQLEFIRQRGLENHIPPIQLAIRLLIPPESRLLAWPDAEAWRGDLDPAAFTYRWVHPDTRMERLYELVSARVERGIRQGEPAGQIHAAIRGLAYAAARRPPPETAAPQRPQPPRLTEDWFC